MQARYSQWLEQRYEANAVRARYSMAARVEKYHGDLDEHYERDGLNVLINTLRYSSSDPRTGRPNPSKIPFDGNPYTNLASYRNSTELYRRFREETSETSISAPACAVAESPCITANDDERIQRIGLERDLQAALRLDIEQLEPGLSIIDGGSERIVASGRVDITAVDFLGKVVVIELKAGVVGPQAISQILSYMGDIKDEENHSEVRGILVGSCFDSKTRSAARVVPNLTLRNYNVRFTFTDGHSTPTVRQASA
jgi:hypothetical protein